MLHEPAAQSEVDHSADYKMRLGVIMFILYSLFYAGFVLLNVVSPSSMETIVLFGMNLACVYGFGLIVVALLQALVYDWMCRKQEAIMNRPSGSEAKR